MEVAAVGLERRRSGLLVPAGAVAPEQTSEQQTPSAPARGRKRLTATPVVVGPDGRPVALGGEPVKRPRRKGEPARTKSGLIVPKRFEKPKVIILLCEQCGKEGATVKLQATDKRNFLHNVWLHTHCADDWKKAHQRPNRHQRRAEMYTRADRAAGGGKGFGRYSQAKRVATIVALTPEPPRGRKARNLAAAQQVA